MNIRVIDHVCLLLQLLSGWDRLTRTLPSGELGGKQRLGICVVLRTVHCGLLVWRGIDLSDTKRLPAGVFLRRWCRLTNHLPWRKLLPRRCCVPDQLSVRQILSWRRIQPCAMPCRRLWRLNRSLYKCLLRPVRLLRCGCHCGAVLLSNRDRKSHADTDSL